MSLINLITIVWFRTFIKQFNPKTIVEFGILDGYSLDILQNFHIQALKYMHLIFLTILLVMQVTKK